MQGRTASECKVFWHGHTCPNNPSINRSKTWKTAENKKLRECVERNKSKNWMKIAKEHNVCILLYIFIYGKLR